MITIRDCHYAHRSDGGAEVPVFAELDFEVADHELLCVLGPSGCGKTTLLRILAGLVQPTRGTVMIDGRAVTGPGPDRAMVFQDHALLPWADALTNIAFGLELRGVARDERLARARALVELVGLGGFAHARPAELSGGMQQRVGLARALAVDPAILLMDEPFGSLDAQTRRSLQLDLLQWHQATPKTVVFVTHSVDEAVRLGDRIVLLAARPSRVAATYTVPLPRPRPADVDTIPAFGALKRELWARLREPAGSA